MDSKTDIPSTTESPESAAAAENTAAAGSAPASKSAESAASSDNLESLLSAIDGVYAEEMANRPLFPETQTDPAEPEDASKQDFFQGNLFSVQELEEAGFIEPQISEITLGLEMGLNVKRYARSSYSWRQMREIRMGLHAKIDTRLYENPLFGVDQMREIRMGLLNHVDASVYASLVLSSSDMHRIRMELSEEAYRSHPNGFAYSFPDESSGLLIRLSADCMDAYITIPGDNKEHFSAKRIKKILRDHEITFGLLNLELDRFVRECPRDKEVRVAHGAKPEPGTNGYYEYFFNNLKNTPPKVNEDGSVDYSTIKVTETVKEDQELAVYHHATKGRSGSTVSGIPLTEHPGQELPPLTGEGIKYDPATETYRAAYVGNVTLDEERSSLNVWKNYTIENDATRYNGSIEYDGTVFVRGDVRNMARIKASGDIVIEGTVEGAELTAGHNIVIRKGVNAGGKGLIKANGSILGSFFESANLEAGGRVEGNYFLGCQINTEDKLIAKGNKSVIQGGQIHASLGVEASYFRTYGGSKTTIEVGNTANLVNQQQEIAEELSQISEEVLRLQDGIHKLTEVFGADLAETRPIYQKTVQALEQKTARMEHLKQEQERLETILQNAYQAYIKIVNSMQPGILIVVNSKRMLLEERLAMTTVTYENFPKEETDESEEHPDH